MQFQDVTLEYGRTVSDGNFGSERVSVTLTASREPGESTATLVEALGTLARDLVTDQLRQARTHGVRRAIEAEASMERR